MRLCENCRVQPSTLRRGAEVLCADCYNLEQEPPLVKPGQWDRVISPVYILALEKRIEALEKVIQNRTADS